MIGGVTVNHSDGKALPYMFFEFYAALLKHLKLLKWIGPHSPKGTF